jgi:quinoprotein glucose dehydrogenase
MESDLIDYTPAIKEAALTLAKKCRMGPYYIPASRGDDPNPQPGHYHCSWYAPGASGGVNIDSGAAADPETGLIYVGSQSSSSGRGMGTIEVQKDPCSEFRFSSPRDSCGRPGALDPPPGYVAPPTAGRGGGGGGGGGGRGGGGGGGVACADVAGARAGTSACGGVSILKPKQMGGVTAYDMKSGDKAWWAANGGYNKITSTDPMFAGIDLPPVPAGGQPQVLNTRTLVIVGTGRTGGPAGAPPKIFALDKASGKEVGTVEIPGKTSAVPMTFLHQGKQYIVFATGSGANTALIALTLPAAGSDK